MTLETIEGADVLEDAFAALIEPLPMIAPLPDDARRGYLEAVVRGLRASGMTAWADWLAPRLDAVLAGGAPALMTLVRDDGAPDDLAAAARRYVEHGRHAL